jgi:hypothetical protein
MTRLLLSPTMLCVFLSSGCSHTRFDRTVEGQRLLQRDAEHWVSRDPVFSPDGRMAYMPGVDEMTVPDSKGVLTTLSGISIWCRNPDGEWRCVIDIANEVPPA